MQAFNIALEHNKLQHTTTSVNKQAKLKRKVGYSSNNEEGKRINQNEDGNDKDASMGEYDGSQSLV